MSSCGNPYFLLAEPICGSYPHGGVQEVSLLVAPGSQRTGVLRIFGHPEQPGEVLCALPRGGCMLMKPLLPQLPLQSLVHRRFRLAEPLFGKEPLPPPVSA